MPLLPACRISAFKGGLEEDVKVLQERDLTPRQRVAAQLRLCEKRILRGTMEGVRRRLAPIRGIPTKVGYPHGCLSPRACTLVRVFYYRPQRGSPNVSVAAGPQCWYQSSMIAYSIRTSTNPPRRLPLSLQQGFQDPNADIIEVFDTIESLPSAPKKLLDGLLGWARGDHDPEWKKNNSGRK